MTVHQALVALEALRESRELMLTTDHPDPLTKLRSLFAVDRDDAIRAICAEHDLNHIAHIYLNVPRERALVRA